MLPGRKGCSGGGVVVMVMAVAVLSLVEWMRLENETAELLLSTDSEEGCVPFSMLKRNLRVSSNSVNSSVVNWREIDGLLLLLGSVPLPGRLLKMPGKLAWVKLEGIAGVLPLFPVRVPSPKRPPSCSNGWESGVLVIGGIDVSPMGGWEGTDSSQSSGSSMGSPLRGSPLPPGGRTESSMVVSLRLLGGNASVPYGGVVTSQDSSIAFLDAIEFLRLRAPN